MTTMHSYLQLLKQPFYGRCTRGGMWLTWLLLAGAAAVLAGCGLAVGGWRRGITLSSVMLGLVAFLWWGLFLNRAVLQNLPAYACLVPQLRRRLLLLTALLSGVLALALAALATLSTGHFGYTLVAASAFIVYLIAAQRYWWLGFVPGLISAFAFTIFKNSFDRPVAAIAELGETNFTLLAMAVIGALFVPVLRLAFPAGGDRHVDWHNCLKRRQTAQRNSASPGTAAGPLARLLTLLRFEYFRSLRRDSERGAPAGRMLMHALGPASQFSGVLVPALILMLLCGLMMYFGADAGDGKLLSVSAFLQLFAMLPVQTYVNGVLHGIAGSKGEQGLMRLAPGMPPPAALNRLLASTLLLRFMLIWTMAAASALAIALVAAHGWHKLGYTFGITALFLPYAALLLTDYAALRSAAGRQATPIGSIIVMLLLMLCVAISSKAPGFPWTALGVIACCVTLIALPLRWRRMLALPPAFPAGRLA